MTTRSDEDAARTLCSHMVPGPYPFESVLVLDDHLGPTDWLVRCSRCGAPCLLEMLDMAGSLRLYRTRLPEAGAVQGLIRDLERGSCDIRRAGEQARHFSLSSRALDRLILLDPGKQTLVRLLSMDPELRIPGASWRELDCDGQWIRMLTATPG